MDGLGSGIVRTGSDSLSVWLSQVGLVKGRRIDIVCLSLSLCDRFLPYLVIFLLHWQGSYRVWVGSRPEEMCLFLDFLDFTISIDFLCVAFPCSPYHMSLQY